MFVYRKCFDGTNCPKAQQLPLGVLAPNSSNQSRLLNRSSLVRNGKGTVVIPDGTTLKTGVFYASTAVPYVAPTTIATVTFDKPFRNVPTLSVVVDDYGNNKAWFINVRNVTTYSFDLVLKNADKATNEFFAVYWTAVGVQ
jgi:hypothetical protein